MPEQTQRQAGGYLRLLRFQLHQQLNYIQNGLDELSFQQQDKIDQTITHLKAQPPQNPKKTEYFQQCLLLHNEIQSCYEYRKDHLATELFKTEVERKIQGFFQTR